MTETQKTFMNGLIASLLSDKKDLTSVVEEDIKSFSKSIKSRVPWALITPFRKTKEDPFDLTSFEVSNSAPKGVAVTTPTDISKAVTQTKPDTKILDKYDNMRSPEKPVFFSGIIVVTNPNEGGVIGVCRTFDTAWNVHKQFRFHDHGEFTDMKVAEEEFNKKGFLVLKSSNAELYVMFEKHELGI